MILTILSGIFGGLLRLAPELLKFLDAKNDRQHELDMQDKQLEFLKVQGQTRVDEISIQGKIDLARADLDVQKAQFDAYQAAMAEQASMAIAGGAWTAAISAIVRPAITFMVFTMWMAYKSCMLIAAFETGGGIVQAIITSWPQDDVAMLTMILSFWFVGRAIEKRS